MGLMTRDEMEFAEQRNPPLGGVCVFVSVCVRFCVRKLRLHSLISLSSLSLSLSLLLRHHEEEGDYRHCAARYGISLSLSHTPYELAYSKSNTLTHSHTHTYFHTHTHPSTTPLTSKFTLSSLSHLSLSLSCSDIMKRKETIVTAPQGMESLSPSPHPRVR